MAGGSGVEEVRDHGGSLSKAMALFPHAPKPWIDCSTGISPHPYPYSALPASAWERLPEPGAIRELCEAAAAAYGAPGPENVVAAPGTQVLLPLVARLVPPGRAAVLGPTYAEHARCAALAGHEVRETSSFEELADADLAILVNPNNPDGRIFPPDALLRLASELAQRGGSLVVDEAFMDVGPQGFTRAPDVEAAGNLVVLRSFGKFFGLAGLRLGFAISAESIVARLRAELGPWAVSGPAAAVGAEALADKGWQSAMRARLLSEAAALDAALAASGLRVEGGTSLFRFLRIAGAQALFEQFRKAGIHVRRFDVLPDALRIGLPPDAAALARIAAALDAWRRAERDGARQAAP